MNPLEHLQPLPTEVLRAIASGEIDAKARAAQLMASRGLGLDGKWVGFEKAAEVWQA